MNRYFATSKRKFVSVRWQFLQLTRNTTACLLQSRMNVRKLVANLPGTLAVAAGIAIADGNAAWQAAEAQGIPQINARVVAINIPGASAISQVGTFLTNSEICVVTAPPPIPYP